MAIDPPIFPRHLKPIEPQGAQMLKNERARASFDAHALEKALYGRDYLAKRNRILHNLQYDPVLGDKSHRYYSGRNVRFTKALMSSKRLVNLARQQQWTGEEWEIADFLFDESGPFRLHRTMFMPTIENQGTEEQKQLFLKPAQRYEIIGCYAQTELGHGSNVRGLETTATYDVSSQTFMLHSPTLTASKWWIGGLGVAATHAIVMARLVTDGKDHGPHPFVVQIRNLEDHQPLPNIIVGDIGPKFGFNTVDNGFILFDHVRVPHIAMLSRYAHVDKETGAYITPPNSKLTYGTMVYVRAKIVLESSMVLARAATVAVRYSAVRIQGHIQDKVEHDKKETPVLDYTVQQYRLFPIVAQAYACHFTGQAMHTMYNENQAQMAKGDFSTLADLHAVSSGLKSLTTTMAVAAIEECRRACGGHGYSLFSGLGQFYQDYLPKATWEGDNYLLTQQTTRYLLKTMRALHNGDRPNNFSAEYMIEYLSQPNKKCLARLSNDFEQPDLLLIAFKHRAAFLIAKAIESIDVEKRSWNDMLVDIYHISRAHCQLVMVTNFFQAVFTDQSSAPHDHVNAVLQRVAKFFALSMLEQEAADLLTSGYISPEQALMVKHHMVTALKKIRPDAVALVDGFGIPDYVLNSALGGHAGQVYERMVQMAEQEPLNKTRVVDGYETCIAPLVHAGRRRWKTGQDGIAKL